MTGDNLYSIRMRASAGDKHLSGAERIVSADSIDTTVNELVARSMGKIRIPDEITLNIENLGNAQPRLLQALDIITMNAPDPDTGRSAASLALQIAGVSRKAVDAAIGHIKAGASPSGSNMRGAMILDADTGERLEPDQVRGVRVTRFDWTHDAREAIDRKLSDAGLDHFRIREALALATKVVHAPGVIAELCWSDDPDYTAGYVASLNTGYTRFPFLKRLGDENGGRAIFISRNGLDLTTLIQYLQNEAVLINSFGKCSSVSAVDAPIETERANNAMFEQELSDLGKQHMLRRISVIESYDEATVTVNGKRLLLMCSNDYLGLAGHPALREAAHDAIRRYGIGSGASRLVSGTGPLHRELEDKIACFKGTEAALVFNSGYAANTGIIPAIAGEGDVILSDVLNHASIVDGCRLSKARTEVYRHCDVNHLEDLLRKNLNARRKLIVTDGVFSMDGDCAPLGELVLLAEKYNAVLMVDDAHATGVLGKSGKGTSEYFGLSGRIPIQMGTFGKALGSFGAYVAGKKDLIEFLLNRSRCFMFSTALPASVCAASIAALTVVEREPQHRIKLWKNRERFVNGLISRGIDIGNTETPIVPLIIGDSRKTMKAADKLLEFGIYAAAIRPPTVPDGAARIRTTIMATHSDEDIDRALDIFGRLRSNGSL
jgi:8-amino-7-oxononanoate synthase